MIRLLAIALSSFFILAACPPVDGDDDAGAGSDASAADAARPDTGVSADSTSQDSARTDSTSTNDAHRTDSAAGDAHQNDAAASTDGGAATGTMSWTANGNAFSEPISVGLDPLAVAGTSVTIASFFLGASTSDYQNSINFTIQGGIPSTSILAGTYTCVTGGGATQMSARVAATGSAQATTSNGGTCSITLANEATNGGTFSGTFSGELIGVQGGANISVTNGSFTVTDKP